jgi:tetratricopeptide (TPR) repeat protein
MNYLKRRCLCFFLFFLSTTLNNLSAQFDWLDRIQSDTSNYYLNQVLDKSESIKNVEALKFIKQANNSIKNSDFNNAIRAIDKSIEIDSSISYNYTIKGYCKLKKELYNESIRCYTKAITLNSSDATNYFLLGKTYFSLKNYAKADSFYSICSNIDKDSYYAYFERANIANLQIKRTESIELYKKVIKLNPKFYFAYFNLAIAYYSLDHKKTLNYLNKTIQLNPNFAEAYHFKGYLQTTDIEMIDPNKALTNYNKAIELDSTNIFYRLSRFNLYTSLGKYNEAIDDIIFVVLNLSNNNLVRNFDYSATDQKSIDFIDQIITYTQYSDIFTNEEKQAINKALCLFCNKKYNLADEIYDKLLEKISNKGFIYYLKGYAQEYLKQPKEASLCYKKAIQQTDFPLETYLRQSYNYTILNQYRDAINSANAFINKNDSMKFAYRCRGVSYLYFQQYDSALIDFKKFINLDNTDPDMYFNCAACYKGLENYPKAIEYFGYVLKNFKANDIESIVQTADCFCLLGDTTKAFNLLNKAHKELHYLNDAGYFMRGKIFMAYSQADSAILDFGHCLKENPKYLMAYVYRGNVYFKQKAYLNALDDFNAALNLNSEDINAIYARGIIYAKINKPDLAYIDFLKADSLGHPLAKKAITVFCKESLLDKK